MKDFKTPSGSKGRKPTLKVPFKARRGKRPPLPKGFQPLPNPRAAEQSSRKATNLRQLSGRALSLLRHPRLRPGRVLLLGALAWMILGAAVGGNALWDAPLRTVTLAGSNDLSVDAVASLGGLHPGMPLSDIDPYALAQKITASPNIRKADVRRVFPGEVIITIEERRPAIRVSERGGAVVLLDEDGVVLESGPGNRSTGESGESLPLVSGLARSALPNTVLDDPALTRGLQALGHMKRLGFEGIERTVIEAGHPFLLRIRLPDGHRLIVPGDRMASALTAYRRMVRETPTLLAGPRLIDLAALGADGGGRVFLRNP